MVVALLGAGLDRRQVDGGLGGRRQQVVGDDDRALELLNVPRTLLIRCRTVKAISVWVGSMVQVPATSPGASVMAWSWVGAPSVRWLSVQQQLRQYADKVQSSTSCRLDCPHGEHHDIDPAGWIASQQRDWRSFLLGTTRLFDRLDRDLREQHALSLPEYEILVRLSEAPDQCLRMAELASSVSHSRSRVTHTVSRLEAAGLVVPRRLRDRRARCPRAAHRDRARPAGRGGRHPRGRCPALPDRPGRPGRPGGDAGGCSRRPPAPCRRRTERCPAPADGHSGDQSRVSRR